MNLSETGQIVIGVGVLIVVYVLTRRYHAWRMAQTYTRIMKDLEQKEAVDPASAVDLPYARPSLFRVGLRDYRPKALAFMTLNNIVGVTPNGRYYLKKTYRPDAVTTSH